jgi:hypothetical protein
MDIREVLHRLLDRSPFHTEGDQKEAHAAIDAAFATDTADAAADATVYPPAGGDSGGTRAY